MNEQIWSEEDSQEFVDLGDIYVPHRQRQLRTISELIPLIETKFEVMELCCGEGLLAEKILQDHPQCFLTGYDASATMLGRAAERLAKFDNRFHLERFELGAAKWRDKQERYQAIVSSLAIHHLDGPEKQFLYEDLFRLLAPGGSLIIADLIMPESALGQRLAAVEWDEVTRQQSLSLNGNQDAFQSFQQTKWNIFHFPDPMDKPSPLSTQLNWLTGIGYENVDVYWLLAGHAIFGGSKPRS